jgi:hypothetical protein
MPEEFVRISATVRVRIQAGIERRYLRALEANIDELQIV